jgi:Mn-dependent DtxR family transcriptional regulator
MTKRDLIIRLLETAGPMRTPAIQQALHLYQPRASVLLRELEAAGCVERAGRDGHAMVWQVVP